MASPSSLLHTRIHSKSLLSLVSATPLREICWVAGGQYADWTLDVAALVARPHKNGEDDLEARFQDKSSSNIRIDYYFYHSTINKQGQRFAKKAALCLVHLHLICVATLGGNVPLTAGFGGQIGFELTDFAFIVDYAKPPSPGTSASPIDERLQPLMMGDNYCRGPPQMALRESTDESAMRVDETETITAPGRQQGRPFAVVRPAHEPAG
ncbi:hypothetical protein MY5147_008278 [Beauveria neobassiana]